MISHSLPLRFSRLTGRPPVVRIAARLLTACLIPGLVLISLPGSAGATAAAPAPGNITDCADLPLGQGAAVHNAALADAAELRQAEPTNIQACDGGSTENPQLPCGALVHVEDALGRYVLVVAHSAVSGVAHYAMLSSASPTSYSISGGQISLSDASSTPEIDRYGTGAGDDASVAAALGPDAQVCTLAFGAGIAVLMQFVSTCGPLGPTLVGAACALGAFGVGTLIGAVVCSGPGCRTSTTTSQEMTPAQPSPMSTTRTAD